MTDTFEVIDQKIKRHPFPFIAHFDITYRCNLKCPYCYVDYDDPLNRTELDLLEIKDILKQLAEKNTLFLTLSGGEIFTRPDIMEIVRAAHDLRFAIILMTNGTIFPLSTIKELTEIGIYQVIVTIMSMRPKTHDDIVGLKGAHQRAVQTIEGLLKEGIRIRINCTISKLNVSDYEDVIRWGEGIGAAVVVDFNITARNDGGLSTKRYVVDDGDKKRILLDKHFSSQFHLDIPSKEDLYRRYEDGAFPCEIGRRLVYITPYGDVTPCVTFPLAGGNLRESSFSQIWDNSPLFKALRSHTVHDLKECPSCDLLHFCSSCPGQAFVEDGDYLGPSRAACNNAKILARITQEKKTKSRE